MSLPDSQSSTTLRPAHRRRWEWIVVAALYVAALAVVGPRAKLSQWQVSPDDLQPAVEALAWLDGHLDLPSRGGDVAEFQGKYFVHFPPLFTFICYGVFWLHRHFLGNPPVFWGSVYVLLVAAPVPLLVYLALRRAMQTECPPGPVTSMAYAGCGIKDKGDDSARISHVAPRITNVENRWLHESTSVAALAFYMLAGTCFWPVIGMLGNKHGGWVYSTQLVMAQLGIAILLIDLFGKRRIWVGGLGIMIAAWSRQPTLLFAGALLWAAWCAPNRKRALALAGVPVLVALAVPMALAWAKFGSPFESGYQYIYAGRDNEALAQRARSIDGMVHIFHPGYVANNAYYYHLCPPAFDLSPGGLQIMGQGEGTSLWIGSPLLLLVLWDARRWWRDAMRRALMLCSVGVNVLLLCYHFTGADNGGYCRYTLDFTLVWLAVIAPFAMAPQRRTFTLACFAWSVFYFYMVT